MVSTQPGYIEKAGLWTHFLVIHFLVSLPRRFTVPGYRASTPQQFKVQWLPQSLVSSAGGIIPPYLINPQFPSQGRELNYSHNSAALSSRQLHCHKFSSAAFALLAVITYFKRRPHQQWYLP